MILNLQGKVAVVTGASKGIGLAVTRALGGRRRARGRRRERRERRTHPRFSESGGGSSCGRSFRLLRTGHRFPSKDISEDRRPRHPRQQCWSRAGFGLKGFLNVTDVQWAASLSLTFMAAVRTTRAALPSMFSAGAGASSPSAR